jgi:ubiquinone/menaquinone biosynthesis C-methylase UbiE
MWAMRATTYAFFERKILSSLEQLRKRPLTILDLGAGNCWMSYRLALRHHCSVALDIFGDERDGLRAARQYPRSIPTVEADFDELPFPQNTFDLIIYNSSFHYSTNYSATLSEARRCLRRSGTVAILDSPIYRRSEHGHLMVAERHAAFLKQYGFRSDSMPSIEFLDKATLGSLSMSLNIRWTIHRPWYGWHWHLRPWKARIQRRRPPSNFWILTGTFSER